MLRLLAAGGTATAAYSYYRKRVPSKLILELDLSSPNDGKKLHEAVTALSLAKSDPNVCGLVANLGSGTALPLAATQELGDAVKSFRKAKGAAAPTFAYSPEFSKSSAYMLAAHFESVVQQPGASLRLPGVCLHLPAIGGLLAKWGLRLEHVDNGRSLGSSAWSERGHSKEQLQHAESVAKSSYEQMVHRVASERGIRERDVRRLTGGTWWSWTMGFFGGSRKRGTQPWAELRAFARAFDIFRC